MKNQSGTIKTNLELDRVVMGGSGGYRRLPGGSDDFSWHTNRHCIIIYISSSLSWRVPSPPSSCSRWASRSRRGRRAASRARGVVSGGMPPISACCCCEDVPSPPRKQLFVCPRSSLHYAFWGMKPVPQAYQYHKWGPSQETAELGSIVLLKKEHICVIKQY